MWEVVKRGAQLLRENLVGSREVLKVRLMDPYAMVPTKASEDSAGYDITSIEEFSLSPGERWLVHTGISIQVPKGTYGRVAGRSGLATKYGITVGAGVIDADYRGEVRVLLFNNGHETVHFCMGDRVAQVVVEKIASLSIVSTNVLEPTIRGPRGYLAAPGSAGGTRRTSSCC
eukprot:Skav226567  [mRNA]  locus=scaffold1701:81740:82258:- [translate_table: standard]